MNYDNFQEYNEELKKHLYCVGTVYDSFDALIEVLGHLKLREPLYLVYLAQKIFANEVFSAANSQEKKQTIPYEPIEIKNPNQHLKMN